MKIRQIKNVHRQVQPVALEASSEERITDWLITQAEEHNLVAMLAHADDGVIWGRVQEGQLITSRGVFSEDDVSSKLCGSTLQQVRLFGSDAELLLWRADGEWRARLVLDGAGEAVQAFDEWQILWGTRRESAQDGFTLVADGALGHRHAPPVEIDAHLFFPEDVHRPLRLQVRHYLEIAPESGLLRIALSRLMTVGDETQIGKEQGQ